MGRIWNKPILTVLVRLSRYTYELITDADSFTVSFFMDESLKQAMNICGTKSGRDIDKFKECGLTPVYVDEVESPYIAEGCLLYTSRCV